MLFFIFPLLMELAMADELQVAAAANFTSALKRISTSFSQESGHKLMISYGSTGKLYAQIINGAPFEVFLSADQEYPKKIVNKKMGFNESIYTYAIGKLVLWSPKENVVDSRGELLTKMNYKHLSISNPKLSPYGKAAQEVLEKKLGWKKVEGLLVFGENINQAHQFINSGSAELGFVSLSQIIVNGKIQGSYWVVPKQLYSPIKQDVVILEKGKNSQAAQDFLKFLKSDKAKAIIKEFGYDLE